MTPLYGINNILKHFFDIVENNGITQAEAMIDGMNTQFDRLSVIKLIDEPIEDRRKYKQLAERFRKLERKLSKDTKTQNLRFNVNNVDRNITI